MSVITAKNGGNVAVMKLIDNQKLKLKSIFITAKSGGKVAVMKLIDNQKHRSKKYIYYRQKWR